MKYYAKVTLEKGSVFDCIEGSDPKSAEQSLKQKHPGSKKITGLGEYLTESKMYFFLKNYFPGEEPIYNRPLSNDSKLGKNINPDFRFESVVLKGKKTSLIIEFDGAQHYTKAFEVLKDRQKDQLYRDMGYEVIRFPYFIQLTSDVVGHYFGSKFSYDNSYAHGFIDKKATLPSDFCELGIERFMNEISAYHRISPSITKSIVNTLKEKIRSKNKTNGKWNSIIEESVIRGKYHDTLKEYGW